MSDGRNIEKRVDELNPGRSGKEGALPTVNDVSP